MILCIFKLEIQLGLELSQLTGLAQKTTVLYSLIDKRWLKNLIDKSLQVKF